MEKLKDRDYIVDIESEHEAGTLKPGEMGGCFTRFVDTDPACKVCYENDVCASNTLRMIDDRIMNIVRAAAAPPPPKTKTVMIIPKAFREFEKQVLELQHVIRLARSRRIDYGFQRRKFVSVIKPASEESIIVMLHNCQKDDFTEVDPKGGLWDKDPDHPDKPFLFVKAAGWEYELNIIAHLHGILSEDEERKKKSVGFNREKYVSDRRQLRKKNKKTVPVSGAVSGERRKKKPRTKTS